VNTPPTVAGEYPAQPSFTWSGHRWYARDSSFRSGGPGQGGNWSRRNVVVNADGSLDLRITNPTGASPVAAEVVSRETFGYGTYAVTVEGDFTHLPPAYVFAVFTFDWSSTGVGPGFNEIDIGEVSSWGGTSPPALSHTYYPDAGGAHSVGVQRWPPTVTQATFRLVWRPGVLTFQVYAGRAPSGTPFSDVTVSAADVPTPKNEAVHVNLWDGSWDGNPADGQHSAPVSFRLTRFSHSR
jgi:hypothetical protein